MFVCGRIPQKYNNSEFVAIVNKHEVIRERIFCQSKLTCVYSSYFSDYDFYFPLYYNDQNYPYEIDITFVFLRNENSLFSGNLKTYMSDTENISILDNYILYSTWCAFDGPGEISCCVTGKNCSERIILNLGRIDISEKYNIQLDRPCGAVGCVETETTVDDNLPLKFEYQCNGTVISSRLVTARHILEQNRSTGSQIWWRGNSGHPRTTVFGNEPLAENPPWYAKLIPGYLKIHRYFTSELLFAERTLAALAADHMEMERELGSLRGRKRLVSGIESPSITLIQEMSDVALGAPEGLCMLRRESNSIEGAVRIAGWCANVNSQPIASLLLVDRSGIAVHIPAKMFRQSGTLTPEYGDDVTEVCLELSTDLLEGTYAIGLYPRGDYRRFEIVNDSDG